MTGWRRAVGMLLLPRKARIGVYMTVADLLSSGFALERALDITAATLAEQGRSGEVWILRRWAHALSNGSMADEIASWTPASEAMIFAAYGRVDAEKLFAGAARVADLSDRQGAAVRAALAMPLLLACTLVVMLWGAGGHFIPVLAEVVPADQWPAIASLFRSVSLWLYANPLLFVASVAGIVFVGFLFTVAYAGPGRPLFDRVAPFSLYRTVVGSAFLFVLLEYLRAGLDLNDRTFEELKRSASPYTRNRVSAIQRAMARGAGIGNAMSRTGHGFPDPSLTPVIAALDGVPQWEIRLSRFVDRWVIRSEALLKARAAVLNAVLLILLTVIAGGAIETMFTLMEQAGQTTSHGRY